MGSIKRSAFGFAVLTAVVVGAAGCGSSSTSPTSSTSAQSPSSAEASPTGGSNSGATLPAGWPADIPVPAGLPLSRVIQSPTTSTGKIAIYYGTGDKTAIDAQMMGGLKGAGYKMVSSSNPNANISISSWKKGSTTVGLNINSAAGKVTCSVSVSPVG